uniref:Helitron_like_N domain-containing protein n=1 Tax=Heligmosomoides polygyrus TaxID=6339 RepID=A0A183GGJ7_HELPZ
MDEVARTEEQRAIEAQRTQRTVRMVFCQLKTDDHRRHNIATANEVGNDEEIPGERYVVLYERGQGLHTISHLDRLATLFPSATASAMRTWRTRVTQREFYSYLLFDRTGTFNPLLHAGKLFQQYNQKKLRLDTVNSLIEGDTHEGPPGRRIILAASSTGGPPHMIAQYQDEMCGSRAVIGELTCVTSE